MRQPAPVVKNILEIYMHWASHAIDLLRQGKTAQIRPRGYSMKGKVESGALVTLAPCKPEQLKVDDIVLVRVKGTVYLHLVKAIGDGRFLIGNNRGRINGWVGPQAIYGIAIAIES